MKTKTFARCRAAFRRARTGIVMLLLSAAVTLVYTYVFRIERSLARLEWLTSEEYQYSDEYYESWDPEWERLMCLRELAGDVDDARVRDCFSDWLGRVAQLETKHEWGDEQALRTILAALSAAEKPFDETLIRRLLNLAHSGRVSDDGGPLLRRAWTDQRDLFVRTVEQADENTQLIDLIVARFLGDGELGPELRDVSWKLFCRFSDLEDPGGGSASLLGRESIEDGRHHSDAKAFAESVLRLSKEYHSIACDLTVRAWGQPLARESIGLLRSTALGRHDQDTLSTRVFVCAVGAGFATEDVPAIFEEAAPEEPTLDQDELIALTRLRNDAPTGGARFVATSRNEHAEGALTALGSPAIPLIAAYLPSSSRAAFSLASHSLSLLDPEALVLNLERRLTAYEEGSLDLWTAEKLRVDLGPLPHSPDPQKHAKLLDAYRVIGRAHRQSDFLAEGLIALAAAGRSERVDFCFMRALSSHSRPVAELCAQALQRRLTRSELTDSIFRYLARKSEFDWGEIHTYENALLGYGASVAPDVVRNLELLLASGGGRPERVFWIHKIIGIRVLNQVGDESALEVLSKLEMDPSSYNEIAMTVDAQGRSKRTEKPVAFSSLCKQATQAIRERSRSQTTSRR